MVGGVAPIRCDVYSNGILQASYSSCAAKLPFSPSSPGIYNLSVTAVDALGFTVTNSTEVVVAESAIVTLVFVSPTNAAIPTIAVGGSLKFTTNVEGGVAPFLYRWYVNDVAIGAESQDGNFTYQPTTPGNASIAVEVTDADEMVARSPSVMVEVSGPGSSGGGNGGSTSSLGTVEFEAVIGAAVVVLAGALLFVGMSKRRRPPPG